MARDGVGGNRPPVEITESDARFLLDMLDRDMGQGLSLMMADGMSREGQERLVDAIEAMRPVRSRLREALGEAKVPS